MKSSESVALARSVLDRCLALAGKPVRLRKFLIERADALHGVAPESTGSVWSSDVARWDEWASMTPAVCDKPGGLLGYRRGPYGYSSYDDLIPELAGLCSMTRVEHWSCDLRDIHGFSASKSSTTRFSDLDAMVERDSPELIADISPAGMRRNLEHRGIALLHAPGQDHFRAFSWTGGHIYVANSDGSHHLAAARYIARKLDLAVSLSAPLELHEFDQLNVYRLRQRFGLYAIPGRLLWADGGVCELLQEMQAPFYWKDMPIHEAWMGRAAIFLPLSDRRSRAAADQFARCGAFDLGKHLADLARPVAPLHELKVKSLRAALIAGEQSGEPRPFDQEAFLSRMRAGAA